MMKLVHRQIMSTMIGALLQHSLMILLVLASAIAHAQPSDLSPVGPDLKPDRIVLNVTEDPAMSMAVTWRTSTAITSGAAQLALADPHPASVNSALAQPATTEPLRFGGLEAHYHSVTFTGLLPNTQYAYRVGEGEHWSEWHHFTTAGTDADELTFLYFGDVQTNILPLWSRVVRQAYRQAPKARLALYAGDLVNRANRDVEWGEWFAAGGFIHASIPAMPTPGNHDHASTDA